MKSLFYAIVAGIALFAMGLSFAYGADGSKPTPGGSCPNCPCEDCKCDAGKPCPVSLARARQDLSNGVKKKDVEPSWSAVTFTEIAYSQNYTKIEWIGFGDDNPLNWLCSNFCAGKTIYLYGKKVTVMQLHEWTSTHVKTKMKADDFALWFSGGEKVSGTTIAPIYYPAPVWPTYPSCPNGRCPLPAK